MKKFLAFFAILIFIIPAAMGAEFMSEYPTNYVQQKLTFFQKFSAGFSMRPFAIVNEGQCSSTPDFVGPVGTSTEVNCLGAVGGGLTGSTSLLEAFANQVRLTGCRVCLYDVAGNDYSPLGCVSIDSDETIPVPNAGGAYEVYQCLSSSCVEKTEYENGGCGSGGCPADKMLRIKEDSCGNFFKECITYTDCKPQTCTQRVGDWGACNNADNTQQRIITYSDCKTKTEIQKCGTIVTTTTPSVNLVEVDPSPSVEVVNTDLILGKTTIKNIGEPMNTPWIMEMQVLPRGQQPLSVISSNEALCDATQPLKPHKTFLLGSGETATIELHTLKSVEDGEYDAYLITRTKCYKDLTDAEKQNLDAWRRPPYSFSKKIGTVCVGDGCADEETVNAATLGSTPVLAGAGVALVGLALYLRKRRFF